MEHLLVHLFGAGYRAAVDSAPLDFGELDVSPDAVRAVCLAGGRFARRLVNERTVGRRWSPVFVVPAGPPPPEVYDVTERALTELGHADAATLARRTAPIPFRDDPDATAVFPLAVLILMGTTAGAFAMNLRCEGQSIGVAALAGLGAGAVAAVAVNAFGRHGGAIAADLRDPKRLLVLAALLLTTAVAPLVAWLIANVST